jgi:hypothetical protein
MHTRIEAFGADRCMFESNPPVDPGEREALFRGTVSKVYRLVQVN